MTLYEFQNSNGISVEDQILLINNSFFPDKTYYPLIYIDQEYINTPKENIQKLWKLRLPGSEKNLFFGMKDRSYDYLDLLKPLFSALNKNESYNIICGKGDYKLSDDIIDVIPDNVNLMLNNVDIDKKNVFYLPMGRDFRSAYLFYIKGPNYKKNNLLYCNFSVNTHPIRKEVYETIKSKSFIKFGHMGNFLQYSITRPEFYDNLAESKFCLCPRGNGIDTFRMWDSLYLGTIPIVVKEAAFHDLLVDLPILFLEDYSMISKLSEEFLEEKYEEMVNKRYNYELLKLDHWISNFES